MQGTVQVTELHSVVWLEEEQLYGGVRKEVPEAEPTCIDRTASEDQRLVRP